MLRYNMRVNEINRYGRQHLPSVSDVIAENIPENIFKVCYFHLLE